MTGPTTITELRSTLLQIPWRGGPPAAGVVPSGPRELYMLEIETQSGLVGMSYLQPLRGGLQTIDACMKELIAPHVIGRDATEVEGRQADAWHRGTTLSRTHVSNSPRSVLDLSGGFDHVWRTRVQEIAVRLRKDFDVSYVNQ